MTQRNYERCERCKRFIGEDCLEGHDGTMFGSTPDGDPYTGKYYCAAGVGCNRLLDNIHPLPPTDQRLDP